jgi:uncharacterized protein YggT (Ycf19 family)
MEETRTTQTVRTDPSAAMVADPVDTRQAVTEERRAFKAYQIIWYIAGLLNALIALRMVFLLLGAQLTGFTQFLYNLTQPFVQPFWGIFGTPRLATGYFDTGAMVAIIIYSLIAWALAGLVDIMTRNRTV